MARPRALGARAHSLKNLPLKPLGSRVLLLPKRKSMATDAEVEAAVKAMRAIPLRGGTVHEDVLRAYARAALNAALLVNVQGLRRRAEALAAEAAAAAFRLLSGPLLR